MKIAITTRDADPTSAVDERFGRAYWILFYDSETEQWDSFDNSAARNAMQGAGIKAAQTVADQGAQAVLTGVTGPKAFRALDAAGVAVFHGASGTAEEALDAWRQGTLERADAAAAVGRP